MRRPGRDECHEYYFLYVDRVGEEDPLAVLEAGVGETLAVLEELGDDSGDRRYAPGKWSVKELLGHLIDSERVFCTRALAFARRDPAPLPDFDQDVYAANSDFGRRPLSSVLDELSALRASTLALLRTFGEDVLDRTGIAAGRRFTVRSIPFILAGHERHHRGVLRERYAAGTR